MILPAVLLCLVAVLPWSSGEEPISIDTLSTSNSDQQKLIVDKHNELRRGVSPPASNMLKMEWNPEAAKNADIWAKHCTFQHSPPRMRKTNVSCGENLFMSSVPFPWPDVIQAWYDEKKDFKYGIGKTSLDAVVGHYTQVVWYRSNEVGCAYAYCPKILGYIYVCQYCPAGNHINSLNTPYKEGTPCGDCPNDCDNGLCTNPCKYVDMYANCANLTKSFGCSVFNTGCPATCQCQTEIK
ncbi:PREDICTED: serotriflin-like [Tinamus guttatus]|uniref:serotriflin-like n=1 Tax=Tinamus guttatus TaxID=94827 RepID=UPI00052EE69A|nr:PREDICTED: serotriflin-like [Tinamus guttatus]